MTARHFNQCMQIRSILPPTTADATGQEWWSARDRSRVMPIERSRQVKSDVMPIERSPIEAKASNWPARPSPRAARIGLNRTLEKKKKKIM